MSTENISAFFNQVNATPELAAKLDLATAETYARIAREAGFPFSAEEFLSERQTALDDQALGEVAGGVAGPGFPVDQSRNEVDKLFSRNRAQHWNRMF